MTWPPLWTRCPQGLGEDGRYFHFGLTSSDVLDTALGLRLTEAADLLLADLDELLAVLKEKAYAYKDQAMVGRSHGVHAEPTTFGLKLALMYDEFGRALDPPGGSPDPRSEKYRARLGPAPISPSRWKQTFVRDWALSAPLPRR